MEGYSPEDAWDRIFSGMRQDLILENKGGVGTVDCSRRGGKGCQMNNKK